MICGLFCKSVFVISGRGGGRGGRGGDRGSRGGDRGGRGRGLHFRKYSFFILQSKHFSLFFQFCYGFVGSVFKVIFGHYIFIWMREIFRTGFWYWS